MWAKTLREVTEFDPVGLLEATNLFATDDWQLCPIRSHGSGLLYHLPTDSPAFSRLPCAASRGIHGSWGGDTGQKAPINGDMGTLRLALYQFNAPA